MPRWRPGHPLLIIPQVGRGPLKCPCQRIRNPLIGKGRSICGVRGQSPFHLFPRPPPDRHTAVLRFGCLFRLRKLVCGQVLSIVEGDCGRTSSCIWFDKSQDIPRVFPLTRPFPAHPREMRPANGAFSRAIRTPRGARAWGPSKMSASRPYSVEHIPRARDVAVALDAIVSLIRYHRAALFAFFLGCSKLLRSISGWGPLALPWGARRLR